MRMNFKKIFYLIKVFFPKWYIFYIRKIESDLDNVMLLLPDDVTITAHHHHLSETLAMV